jgi:hypothetical protein
MMLGARYGMRDKNLTALEFLFLALVAFLDRFSEVVQFLPESV